jgi:hypothetical protein
MADKKRVKGDTVIHTPQGVYHGDRYEGPRGLTNEQQEAQRVGAKIGERHVREAAHGERGGKPALENLDGTDEVADTRKGGRRPSES